MINNLERLKATKIRLPGCTINGRFFKYFFIRTYKHIIYKSKKSLSKGLRKNNFIDKIFKRSKIDHLYNKTLNNLSLNIE